MLNRRPAGCRECPQLDASQLWHASASWPSEPTEGPEPLRRPLPSLGSCSGARAWLLAVSGAADCGAQADFSAASRIADSVVRDVITSVGSLRCSSAGRSCFSIASMQRCSAATASPVSAANSPCQP